MARHGKAGHGKANLKNARKFFVRRQRVQVQLSERRATPVLGKQASGKNVQPNDGLARRDERDKGVGCNNPTTLHVRTKRTGAHIMKTLEEVLDWLDTQLLKHQSLVLLTREDASTLSQALTQQLGKEARNEQAEDNPSYS